MNKNKIISLELQDSISIFMLLFLAILDGHFTSLHLANGATEANPLLAYALKYWDITGLLWVKFAITIPCLLILQNYTRFSLVQKSVHLLLGIYACLMLYHLWGFTLA